MPPKKSRNKGKKPQGQERDDQLLQPSLPQTRDDLQQSESSGQTQQVPQRYATEHAQPRGAEGYRVQRGQQGDVDKFGGQQRDAGAFKQQTGTNFQQPESSRQTQRNPAEIREQPQHTQPRRVEGFGDQRGQHGDVDRFGGQQRDAGAFRQQTGTNFQQAESSRQTQQVPQRYTTEHAQPRGAEGYRVQRGQQGDVDKFGGQQRDAGAFKQQTGTNFQQPESSRQTQRNPAEIREQHQHTQPRRVEGFEDQRGQHGDVDRFGGQQRDPGQFRQQGVPQQYKQPYEKTEEFKQPPTGQSPWTPQPKQSQHPYQESFRQQPQRGSESVTSQPQQVPPKGLAPAWKTQGPKDIVQQIQPITPSGSIQPMAQTSPRDEGELLKTKLEALSLTESEAITKAPIVDTPKGTGDAIATTSSNSPVEAASTRSTPKKTQYVKVDMKYKISPSIQQKFLPKRPDPGGKQGRSIPLIINCLNMKINPMKVYMYDIELTKAEVTINNKKRDVKVKIQRKEVLRIIVHEYLKDKGGVPVFDGSHIIFSNQMLQIDNSIVNKIEFKCIVDEESVSCHFNLQRVKEDDIELSNLTNYVESGQGRSDNLPQEALRALDAIMKEMFMNKNLISLNRRAIFDPKTAKPLRCGPYLLMEGYATTVRPHMWKIRFNFDKTQVVIHKPINLYDYIGEITSGFRNFYPDTVKKKIHLLRVEAKHLKNTEGKSYSRKYSIHGFSHGDASKEMIAEKKMSVQQYFLTEYKIVLKYPNRPLIKTHPTNKTYVPMELLTVLPHQRVLVNDPAIVQEVIRSAAIPPFERLKILREAIKTLKFGDRADKFIKNYMIEIDDNLINVNGRVLEGPQAQFGGRPELLRGGKWDIRGKKFFQPHPKTVNWALFAVGTERDYQRNEQPLYDIEAQLPDSAGRVGVKMEPMYMFQYITWQKIDIDVPNIIERSEKEKKRLDLLVFIINRDEDYKAVKRFGDMTFGIATQCMKYATLQRQKGFDQYLGNIMLKVNTKLGGINWELMALINKNFSPIKGRFMVFGIDVTHPSTIRNDLAKSIAAMVGSLDHAASLYSAVIRQQITKEERSIVEVVLDMEDMVHKLLLNFYKANKTLKPDHLLFYRDGVSEGQFEIVFKQEIIAIQNACTKLQPDYQPKITYIVVQKRHKIRFFPSDQKDAIGKSGNVPAGTVVDKDITHCREFDFYLCSHEGIQGTSKPAHYHVLFDENNWGSDDLQSFTYFLCHVYARSTRSVSYPAPTYYAHLAAFRGRALIGETADDSSSSASGQTQRTTESREAQITIHDYHDNKLFFI